MRRVFQAIGAVVVAGIFVVALTAVTGAVFDQLAPRTLQASTADKAQASAKTEAESRSQVKM